MNRGAAHRRTVSRHRAADYWLVSRHLMESARTLLTLGDAEYGNAIGICIIHAVISANDAITIHLGQRRSSSDQDSDALTLLQELECDVPAAVLRAYSTVVRAKAVYEYSGDIFTPAAAHRLMSKAETFCRWAQARLASAQFPDPPNPKSQK